MLPYVGPNISASTRHIPVFQVAICVERSAGHELINCLSGIILYHLLRQLPHLRLGLDLRIENQLSDTTG